MKGVGAAAVGKGGRVLGLEELIVAMTRGESGIRSGGKRLPEAKAKKEAVEEAAKGAGATDAARRLMGTAAKLAFVAGVEAMKGVGEVWDAEGTGNGKGKIREEVREGVGVVFASSFAHSGVGLVEELQEVEKGKDGEDGEDGEDNDVPLRKRVLACLLTPNAQIAEAVGARGPNMVVGSACASTVGVMGVADAMLRGGKAKHVLVVGGDAPLQQRSREAQLSFYEMGALAQKESPPFAEERCGFVLGEGGVGLLLSAVQEGEEGEEGEEERKGRKGRKGETRRVFLAAVEVANSAHHGSRIDAGHVGEVMGRAMKGAGVSKERAGDVLYVSHETGTRLCATAEAEALRSYFGEKVGDVLITNSKWCTGHTQGACIEDAVAVVSLQTGCAPPLPFPSERDPTFEDLSFSDGSKHRRKVAVHVAMGLGSQVGVAVYEMQ